MSRPYNEDLELISAHLDGELHDATQISAVEQRLQTDTAFRMEYMIVKSARAALRSNVATLRHTVPADVLKAVRTGMAVEPLAPLPEHSTEPLAPSRGTERSPQPRRSSRLRWGTASIGIVAVGMCLWWFIRPQPTTPDGALPPDVVQPVTTVSAVDVYQGAYANFASIMRGELKVALASSDTAQLSAFFAHEGVAYPVEYPRMKAKLVGGVVSHHGNMHYAHLVYQCKKQIIYLFEVDEPSFVKGMASMPQKVMEQVRATNWHAEDVNPIGTMVVWKRNNVVCSAVSKMSSADFSALLEVKNL